VGQPERVLGLDAELLDEKPACLAVRRQGLGRSACAVQGEHQPAGQPLVQRVFGEQPLQLTDELGVPPHGEVDVDAPLERNQASFLESRRLCLRVPARQTVEGRSAPQRERVAQGLPGLDEEVRLQRRGGVPLPLFELAVVQRRGRNPEPVALRTRLDHRRVEQPSQGRDVHLDRVREGARGLAVPQQVGDPGGRHDIARL
jgi:hypothetical protein